MITVSYDSLAPVSCQNDKETIEDTNEREHGHENLIPVSLTTPA